MQKKRQHIEDDHQEALIKWFNLQYPKELMYCIPNQLIRSCQQAIIMAKRGLISGMPDVVVAKAKAPWHSLYIELKQPSLKNVPRGGVSDAQQRVIRHLLSRRFKVLVCYGWDEAREAIKAYMENGKDAR